MNYKPITKLHNYMCVLYPIIILILIYILKIHCKQLIFLIPIFILWIFVSILTMKPHTSFVATIISFSISNCLYCALSFIFLILLSPYYYNTNSSPHLILVLLTSFTELIIIIGFFHIKRFQKGMPFLFSTPTLNKSTILCLCLLCFTVFTSLKFHHIFIQIIALFVFIFTYIFLIHWWQAQITKSYKHSLQIRELESLRVELQEKDKVLSELKAQNEQLGRLIHHDNKRIPAMEHAVSEYLVSDFDDVETTKEKGEALLVEIRDLSASRTNTLAEIYAKKFTHYDTGISALDTILNYMNKRASQRNTDLSVHIAVSLEDYIPRIISSDDLTHILSDLLENALIATESCADAAIQLQFYQSEKHFVVEVSDNGIPFTIDSFLNMGLSRLTTHADTGGSGIGLMDIWEIKEKYGATLHIEEFEQSEPFSKKISLVFNRKNLYSIRTWRSDEISKASKRNDLRVYEYGI